MPAALSHSTSNIMRLGVIDCGTNTFHLLIASPGEGKAFVTHFRERNYVRLGEEGLSKIGQEPMRRGVECLKHFKEELGKQGVTTIKAFGTEALRKASNGADFIRAAEAETGLKIQLITGGEEARLIHLGVMQAVPPFEGKALIMDIGGGSVEFIIVSQDEVHWVQSFPIGVQVLFSDFQKNDPISQGDLFALQQHLERTLQPLQQALHAHKTPLLLGASGSFEVIEDMLVERKPHPLYSVVSTSDYYRLHSKVLASSLAERLQMPKLPAERAELLPVAFVLVDYIIRLAGIHQIIPSAYAMKEGILKEMLDEV
jgi:exopolyphosphatase / guanosine-5'-triphosphate,3'-diphosphate pyrophosphatase